MINYLAPLLYLMIVVQLYSLTESLNVDQSIHLDPFYVSSNNEGSGDAAHRCTGWSDPSLTAYC